jgi:large subunit ribosomal protein L4
MPTLPIYKQDGTQTGEVELPEAIFGARPNEALLHKASIAALAGQRQGHAHTKTRGEVTGSTRKLWRQKGTGRARVGDRHPPHRIGGGVAMGPRPRSYAQRLPKSAKLQGLRSALSALALSGDLIVVESLQLPEAKTKAVRAILDAVGAGPGTLLVLAEPDELVWRCGRNIPGLTIRPAADLCALDLLTARTVVMDKDAIPPLEGRLS